jgi:hypothetical protein
LIPFTNVEEFRNGVKGTVIVGGLGEIVDIRQREPVSIPVRKWFDQDVLNDAEDDGGCTDTQCEREDRQQSEPTVFLYAADCKANILPERVESLHALFLLH